MSKYHGHPARHLDRPRGPRPQVWYIVRDGSKRLIIVREPNGLPVVRKVVGKMAAAQKVLKGMQR